MTSPVPPPAPRVNPKLVGHTQARAAFLQAWRTGRMAHAWILAGPPGIGKASLAFAMSRFVLEGGTRDALGTMREQDPVFRLVSAGSHPDLLTIERPMDAKGEHQKAEIPVDSVRQLGDFLSKATSRAGGWRVVIVDGAQSLNRHGQNALLKNLEEPPGRSLILLTTTHPQSLLPTIRSRCRVLPLLPLTPAEMNEVLRGQTDDLSPSDLSLMTALAQGAPGRLLALLEAGGPPLYHELMACLAAPDQANRRLALAERCSGREGQEVFSVLMEWLAAWLGRLVMARVRQQPMLCLADEEAAAVQTLAAQSTQTLLAVAESLRARAHEALGINLDRKAVFLGALGLVAS
ncbi:MAG: DNA polymerase III subunit delta' [Alphaproteobacteria bacterium]|nr:MAG: DNA polymerase III subunit delta' [Alphaproteobacteria bacterium]